MANMVSKKVKRWSVIFKTLSSVNRLKIIELLKEKSEMPVYEISDKLNISVQATSRHLTVLNDLDILNSEGKSNSVFYSINSDMPKDFKTIIKNI